MMQVAVRYCGGCNPRYDRVAAVRALQANLPMLSLCRPDAEQPLPALLVCGCSAACASREGLGEILAVLSSEEALPEAEAQLRAYCKRMENE